MLKDKLESINIKGLRLFHAMTQRKVFEQLEISETAYRRKETGEVSFTVEELVKLCEIFEMSEKEMIKIILNTTKKKK